LLNLVTNWQFWASFGRAFYEVFQTKSQCLARVRIILPREIGNQLATLVGYFLFQNSLVIDPGEPIATEANCNSLFNFYESFGSRARIRVTKPVSQPSIQLLEGFHSDPCKVIRLGVRLIPIQPGAQPVLVEIIECSVLHGQNRASEVSGSLAHWYKTDVETELRNMHTVSDKASHGEYAIP
jgi:hypothetical protein